MYQPHELKSTIRLNWSTGRGVDVWQLFCECIAGNISGVKQLVESDASLVRCHYGYRTPLYFAVKENQIAIAQYLLERSADPLAMEFGDSFVLQANDRGYHEMATLLTEYMAKRHAVSPLGDRSAELIRAGEEEGLRNLLHEHPEALHQADRRSNQPIHWAVIVHILETAKGSIEVRSEAQREFLTSREQIWFCIRDGKFPSTYISTGNRTFNGATARTAIRCDFLLVCKIVLGQKYRKDEIADAAQRDLLFHVLRYRETFPNRVGKKFYCCPKCTGKLHECLTNNVFRYIDNAKWRAEIES